MTAEFAVRVFVALKTMATLSTALPQWQRANERPWIMDGR